MDFSVFKKAVQKQFAKMQKLGSVFRVELDRDRLWETYLNSFEDGDNPMFRERTEHDCSCCRQFIKQAGGMVVIHKGEMVSLWDVKVGGKYQPVADALSALVKSRSLDNIYLYSESAVGVDKNFEEKEGETRIQWEHFYLKLPASLQCQKSDIGTKLGRYRSTFDVMFRSLDEITVDAIDTVLELIGQKSLYRGEEHTATVKAFKKLKTEFDKAENKTFFCWSKVQSGPETSLRVRNTAIGTLLVDLSNEVELDRAVGSFEAKVAPENYKRPTALVTKGMIKKAQEDIKELGFSTSIERRLATLEDISVNDVLFADRSAKELMNDVFDEVAAGTPEKIKSSDKLEEVSIDTFLAEVLPKAESLELLVENRHNPNFVSLVAPEDKDAPLMFKWPNPFSWSYSGEVTDSIKERVKMAGGNVTGDLRCSLSWFNSDDLDLHMKEAGGYHIYYGSKHSNQTKGQLDVDMNAGGRNNSVDPVENITYPNRRKMKNGIYVLSVNQYTKRSTSNVGFDVEIEFDGNIFQMSYPKALPQKKTVEVARIQYKDGEFKILSSLPTSQTPKTVWNVTTQSFHKVQTVMFSPNYWGDKPVGNRHCFFFLEGCKHDSKARGFYNEFLTAELDKHRKVLEIVGSKTTIEGTDSQLSGLGFSSTKRNSIVCRVRGSFRRDLKIIF